MLGSMTHASTAEGRAAHSGDATAPDGVDPAVGCVLDA